MLKTRTNVSIKISLIQRENKTIFLTTLAYFEPKIEPKIHFFREDFCPFADQNTLPTT